MMPSKGGATVAVRVTGACSLMVVVETARVVVVGVPPLTTGTKSGALVDGVKPGLPPNAARIPCGPGSSVTVMVATPVPASTGDTPMAVPATTLSVQVIVPPAGFGVTVAVKVTDDPKGTGFGLAPTSVMVATGPGTGVGDGSTAIAAGTATSIHPSSTATPETQRVAGRWRVIMASVLRSSW